MAREKYDRKADERMLKKLRVGDRVQYKNKTGVISKFTSYKERKGCYGNRITYNYTSVTVCLDDSNKHITVSPRNLVLLKRGDGVSKKEIRCPNCNALLKVCVDVSGVWFRTINQYGQIGNKIQKGSVIPNGAVHLDCPECFFSYDCEHASNDEQHEYLDNWISENIDEIMDWSW